MRGKHDSNMVGRRGYYTVAYDTGLRQWILKNSELILHGNRLSDIVAVCQMTLGLAQGCPQFFFVEKKLLGTHSTVKLRYKLNFLITFWINLYNFCFITHIVIYGHIKFKVEFAR